MVLVFVVIIVVVVVVLSLLSDCCCSTQQGAVLGRGVTFSVGVAATLECGGRVNKIDVIEDVWAERREKVH